MTSLGTAILLTLTTVGGIACDSNPTPHPQNDTYRGDFGANVGGGEVSGSELPTGAEKDPDDLEPAVPDHETDQNGSADECPDAEVFSGESAADVRDDDNETRVDDASPASGQMGDEDCGSSDATPVPGESSSDNDQVEGHQERHMERPTRAP